MLGLRASLVVVLLAWAAHGCEERVHGPCSCSEDRQGSVYVQCTNVVENYHMEEALLTFRVKNIGLMLIQDSPELTFLSDDMFDDIYVQNLQIHNTGMYIFRGSAFSAAAKLKLEVLGIVNSGLMAFEDNMVNGFSNLKYLDLRGNKELKRLKGALTLQKLNFVTIVNNRKFSIDEMFFKNLPAAGIDLRANDLDAESFGGETGISFSDGCKELTLNENNFAAGLPKITANPDHLYLANSNIEAKSMKGFFKDQTRPGSKTNYNLIDNPIVCDCDMKWVAKLPAKKNIIGFCFNAPYKGISDLTESDFVGCT